MKYIIENATIIYKNGSEKIFRAIKIKELGVWIGKIDSKNGINKNFLKYSFIPNDQIQKIMYFDQNGKLKDIDF